MLVVLAVVAAPESEPEQPSREWLRRSSGQGKAHDGKCRSDDVTHDETPFSSAGQFSSVEKESRTVSHLPHGDAPAGRIGTTVSLA